MAATIGNMALSYSQLSSYRRCPKQYEYASIKKIPRRMSAGESFGSSVHDALRRWGKLELAQTKRPDAKRQLTLFTEHAPPIQTQPIELTTLLTLWRESFIAEGYASRTERDAGILRGDGLLRQFFEWWQTKPRTVVTIESGFKLTVPEEDQKPAVILSGRFDRIERTTNGLLIIDYKTGEPRTQQEIDSDLQLSIYALAAAEQFKEPVDSLTLLFLGEHGLRERQTKRNPSQLRDAVRVIRHLSEGILSGDVHATPSVSVCRHCPYREMCPARAM